MHSINVYPAERAFVELIYRTRRDAENLEKLKASEARSIVIRNRRVKGHEFVDAFYD